MNEENEMKLTLKKIKYAKGCTAILAITAYYIIFNEDE